MTDIEKIDIWIREFPGGIPENFQVDFTSEIPQNAGLFPTGTMELRRQQFINGDVVVTNQYNFGLYAVFEKPSDSDEISRRNAEWVMSFQRWVQEQSVRGAAPKFGNVDTGDEIIRAQNGMFFGDKEQGVGVYVVTITVIFKTIYEEEN